MSVNSVHNWGKKCLWPLPSSQTHKYLYLNFTPAKNNEKKKHDQILTGNLPFIAPNNKCINRVFKGKRGKINIYIMLYIITLRIYNYIYEQ